MARFELILGDITQSEVDAIVNAANTSLLGGSGVDGAIHRVAGPRLLEECRKMHGCLTGEVKLTAGYDLPACHVIHSAGPIWQGGGENEAALLAACYRNALELAAENGYRTLDFPSISTGAYGYPIAQAATVALHTIMDFLDTHTLPEQVRMVCHTESALAVYQQTYNMWFAGDKSQRL